MKHLFPVAVAQLKSQFSKPLVSVRNNAEIAILHSKANQLKDFSLVRKE